VNPSRLLSALLQSTSLHFCPSSRSTPDVYLTPVLNATGDHRRPALFNRGVHTLHPLDKMALGFGKKNASDSSNHSSSPPNEKAELKSDGINPYNDYSADQTTAEHGGSKKFNKPMNRIDRPLTKSITGDSAMGDSSTDVSVSIGKQMELEADNAIKYRTCSWQKVCYGPLFLPIPFLATSIVCAFLKLVECLKWDYGAAQCNTAIVLYVSALFKTQKLTCSPDRGSAVLRVHLLGHYVLPVFLLRSRIGAGSDLDFCHRGIGPLHLFDHLVSLTSPKRLITKLTVNQGILHETSRSQGRL
jgi:hypothetical protein